MKSPKSIIIACSLMTFAVGIMVEIMADLLSHLNSIGPLGFLLIGCIIALFILVPAFFYDLFTKNVITIEKKKKETIS